MSRSAERLLGYVVWKGGKRYVRHRYRRRRPSTRTVAFVGIGALAVGAVATLARRALV